MTQYSSVFDIPIKDKNGNPNMLDKYRGKVLMFVNTTGHCGNASQWPILNSIMDDYRDRNFQIIYVPTNDYCGSVTVAPYKDGIKSGTESFEFANNKYGIEDPFTELTSSRNTPWEFKVDQYLATGDWTRNHNLHSTVIQPPRGELYNFLLPPNNDIMSGNFHKIITNSKGIPVASIPNFILNTGPRYQNIIEIYSNKIWLNACDVTDLVLKQISWEELQKEDFPTFTARKILHNLGANKIHLFNEEIPYNVDEELLYDDIIAFREKRAKQDIIDIKNILDEVLETDKCTHPDYTYSTDQS